MSSSAVVPVAPHTFGEAMRIGEVLAESGFFADTPTAAKAIVKMLAGRELGFGPIQSMTGVDIIQGQVAVKPKLLASAIQRSPHFRYRVTEHTEDHCSIEFYEDGELAGVSTFTIADATKAGLAGKTSWKQYPRNMLWARAMSNGANWYCAGIFGGPVYTPEELGAEVNGDGEIVGPVGEIPASPGAQAQAPGSGSAVPPQSPTSTETLDDAIRRGAIAVEAPETPSAATEVSEAESPTPQAPSATEAQEGPTAGAQTPSELARSYGIADATQRFILMTVVGLDEATDLDAAYRSLDEAQLKAVVAEWKARAK
jgi:hypothetical protein